MELVIPIKPSKFNNTKLTELVNKDRVEELLTCELIDNFTNTNGLTINEYTQLEKYLRRVSATNPDTFQNDLEKYTFQTRFEK